MIEIEVFTDGSCIKKCGTGYAVAGYGIYFPNSEIEDVSRPFLHTPITNQRAELYAIYVALFKIIKHLDVDRVIIYSDSEYSIKSLTIWIHDWVRRGWKKANKKPVENQDILKLIYRLMDDFVGEVKFIHVRAHTGKQDYRSLGNAKADKLATDGAKKSGKVKESKKRSSTSKKYNISIDTSYESKNEDPLPPVGQSQTTLRHCDLPTSSMSKLHSSGADCDLPTSSMSKLHSSGADCDLPEIELEDIEITFAPRRKKAKTIKIDV